MTAAQWQSLSRLEDQELRGLLKSIAFKERARQVEMLYHLAELNRRGTFVAWGYSSLWDFCRRELLLSEGTAVRYIASSKGLEQWPVAEPYLRDGRISICVFSVIAAMLNAENVNETLEKTSGMTRREAQDFVENLGHALAKQLPKRDVVKLVAKIAKVPPSPTTQSLPILSNEQSLSASAKVETPQYVEVHRVAFNADESVVNNLKRLQELLGNADLNDIVRRASEALLDRVDPVRRHNRRLKKRERKANSAAGDKPAAATPKRRQPIEIRDAVHVRDESRCTFQSKDGVRCIERGYLHLDHIKPYAIGGSSTDIANSRLLCAVHNLFMAKQTYGEAVVQRAIEARRARLRTRAGDRRPLGSIAVE
jgi:5-methylcytosine-specific restriction endonuclease McrA